MNLAGVPNINGSGAQVQTQNFWPNMKNYSSVCFTTAASHNQNVLPCKASRQGLWVLIFVQNEKSLQQWLDQELEVAVRVHEVRSAYEKQMEE
jgi:hypothetical protein